MIIFLLRCDRNDWWCQRFNVNLILCVQFIFIYFFQFVDVWSWVTFIRIVGWVFEKEAIFTYKEKGRNVNKKIQRTKGLPAMFRKYKVLTKPWMSPNESLNSLKVKLKLYSYTIARIKNKSDTQFFKTAFIQSGDLKHKLI